MKNNRFEIFAPSVLQLAKTVQQIKSRKMAEYDLKGTNAHCLCEILDSGEEGLTAAELSARCEIDKAQVSRCMAELIERKLAYRNDEEGRRYKQKYHLTESGLQIARDIDETAKRVQKTVRHGLSAEDMEHFERVLHTLSENFGTLSQSER